ncbi:1-acyl-sn-glycerol-3-phosphate acyltransferase [Phenylobacterium sp.]|jgi:1-acyl-sn-glycerol-3-phosphate acyltransferase|uniref:lysophospholipid acyltransferase family protein n=1 Tax=Phenylobacterium sp. TaxID=1871053 RepID=UPI002F956D6F
MRAFAFAVAYYAISIPHVLAAAVAALRPGRGAVRRVIARYARRMVWAMRVFAGIQLEVRGREHLPQGAFIIAAKHQSWGDGFLCYSQFEDLAFVTGDHLERFPLFKGILQKLGAIVVDSCGGPEARAALSAAAAKAREEGRKILIYPEGALAPVGARYRYRTGVYHMAQDFEMVVVPAATNLGLYWPQQKFAKHAGTAILEFLPPIPLGLDKAEFMARLEDAIETRTAELVAEATGQPVTPSRLEVPPHVLAREAKEAAATA